MSFYIENKKQIEIGFKGEEIVRNFFKTKNIEYFQADLIFYSNKKYFLAEIKAQEYFEKPPFDGHGLPKWQIEARLKFFKETGIKPYLFIYDTILKKIFYQSFEILMQGEKYQTKGQKPRLIFPLENFKIIKI